MKRIDIPYLILSLLLVAYISGCSEDMYENVNTFKPSLESHYLSVYPRDFEFGNGEETQSGSISTENAWSFTSVPSWLTLSPASGNSDAEFSATSQANETASSRTAVFYLTANGSDWSKRRAITASQYAASPFFEFVDLENNYLYLSGEPHKITINVNTNIEDLATKIAYGEDWLSASYENKQLTITVNGNDEGTQRSGRVELWSSTFSKGGKIYITQYKPNLSFNEITSLSFNADGGTQTVKVSSDLPWLAQSNESWIEISPSNGNEGDNQIKITALPSYQSGNRSGKVLFYHKENQSDVGSISVSQTGRYINVSPSSVTLSASENSSDKISIESNIGWIIDSHPEWLSFSDKSGDRGESTITLTASKNNSLNSRSGTVIIKDSGSGGIESRVSVTQNGLDFGDQTTLEFGWQESTLSKTTSLFSKLTYFQSSHYLA